MKSQILSLSGFIRLPWIAWALPQTLETDMGGPTLAGVLASLELFGSAHTAILVPDRRRDLRRPGRADDHAGRQASRRRAIPELLRLAGACAGALSTLAPPAAVECTSRTWTSDLGRLAVARRRRGARLRGARVSSTRRRSSIRRARLGGALLALALLGAVVGVVEAAALEVDRRRVQHPLDRAPADLALGQRVVVHALQHLEGVPLRAAVLIDRHRDR